MTRIVLVDDHVIVRSGVKLLLELKGDFRVVGEAGSGEQLLSELPELMTGPDEKRPDVIVLDLKMNGIGGFESCRRVRQQWPLLPVLVLTMSDDPSHVREAFSAGASGYVLKEAADIELEVAVQSVAAGGQYLLPSLGASLLQAPEPDAPPAAAIRTPQGLDLSAREVDVLRLVAQGYSNKEIGEELFISSRTVETHRTHIAQKTGLRNRSQLVRFARESGLGSVAAVA
ncbi:MAG TPA: response regulator transcription factor [Actinomycetota bacterium]|nr:response regulator transcription factor [Actinomycetota bacterium]